jgi:site-specific DNA recombinase
MNSEPTAGAAAETAAPVIQPDRVAPPPALPGSSIDASQPPNATAVIYVRVSTKEQAQRDGDPEGYSIPAQREACQRKAAALGAVVVEEFIDRGESARSTDRPDLQRMLVWLAENPVSYVIVHKVDRLARNRMDDVTITAAIRASGAQLVSVTENIDETPSGALLHGIMSSIAEFYSRNLANEVIKGTQQKVLAGGTPTRAPIGYRNVRREVDGHEVRTVELDPERGPLIAWAFEAYASGKYSLRSLASELEARGLTYRATAKQAARPVAAKKLGELLRNRYYLGVVTWRGVEYPGKHQPLVDPVTFVQVQQVLDAHRVSGERSYRNHHYLAGTLYCGRCGSKLIYGIATGRRGDRYQHFFCMGRHTYKNGCELPYLPVVDVEDAVSAVWATERPAAGDFDALEAALNEDLRGLEAHTEHERTRLRLRQDQIQRERYKWAEKAMEGAVPGDIAREKQRQLGGQLEQVQVQLGRLQDVDQETHQILGHVATILSSIGQAYQRAGDSTRRDFNQAWFDQMKIDCDEDRTVAVSEAQRTELGQALITARVVEEDERHKMMEGSAELDGWGGGDSLAVDLQHEQERRSFRYGVLSHVGVSNLSLLVELRGFEPLTPSMRTRCATGLRYSPNGWTG